MMGEEEPRSAVAPWIALHRPGGRPREAELLVKRMRVLCVEQPLPTYVRPLVDDEPDEREPQPAPAELGEHVHVRQVREGDAVGHGPREPDLPALAIEADDALRLAHEALDRRARAALRPVRLAREVVVDGV